MAEELTETGGSAREPPPSLSPERSAPARRAPVQRRTQLLRLAGILLVLGITIGIFVFRDRARELALYGYPGIFLFSVLANATVFLPAPGLALVFTMGAVLHPMGVSLAAGAGSTLGELSGYLAGFSGTAVIENVGVYQRVSEWMSEYPRYSYLAVFVLALVPNPFFDLAGIAAGALRMPLTRFLFWVLIGKILKMMAFAYLGAGSLGLFFGL